MAIVNMNLSGTQIIALENILAFASTPVTSDQFADLAVADRTINALNRLGVLVCDDISNEYSITPYGIQSYCATILTKYDGNTHERIHSALGNYQRLFNGAGYNIASA